MDALVRRLLPLLGLFVLLGLCGWAWDGVRHDHGGEHGAPLTVEELRVELMASTFTTHGRSQSVRECDCVGVGDRHAGGYTHFRCDLRFVGGGSDNVVVHVRPTELTFKSGVA